MKPLRRLLLAIRDIWSASLGLIPLSVLDPIRHAYRASPGGSLRHLLCGVILGLLRYRSLGDGPEYFPIQRAGGLQLANDGSLISRRIYWFGPDGHEPGVARLWNLFCKKADRVLEIGSNVGYFTITGAAACRPGVKYLAAEPNPAAFSRLSSNVTINGLDQTVERLPYAIVGSATTRKMTFCVSKLDTYAAQAGSHLAAVSAPAADERVFEVDVLQSSEIIAGVDALKIDAEGAEYDILSAVSQPVAERRCLLVVEVLDAAKILKQFLAGFAKDHGYRIFVIGDALVEVTPDRIADLRVGRTFGSRDVCLVPEEKVEGLVSEFAALGICEICATAGSRLAR